MKKVILSLAGAVVALTGAYAQNNRITYAGADISLLTEYEDAGAQYLDYDGNPLEGSALDFFKQEGLNLMRVRVFVDPSAYDGPDKDPNACQDLEYIKPICKRIVDAGIPLMLDFHYSDTWADPVKQWTPASWLNLSNDALYQKIYDYTRETLVELKNEGIVPSFVCTGNEISYGMLWGSWDTDEWQLKKCWVWQDYEWDENGWKRLTSLLKQAGKAVREICPNAKIILHTERTAEEWVQKYFYDRMKAYNVDYDIIGLSYYPYFHGALNVLETAVKNCEQNFPEKDIMVVETGYTYEWEVPGTSYDYSDVYPYSVDGQASFTHDLIEMLKKHASVTGAVWWWAEYNAYGTELSNWYNAPLFSSLTGCACPAIKELASFATKDVSGIGAIGVDSEEQPEMPWYNLQGQRIDAPTRPGMYIHGDKKVFIR